MSTPPLLAMRVAERCRQGQSTHTRLNAAAARPYVASGVDVVVPQAVDTAAGCAGSGMQTPITAASMYASDPAASFSAARHASSDTIHLNQGGGGPLSAPYSDDDEILAFLTSIMHSTHAAGSGLASAPAPAPATAPLFATATVTMADAAQFPHGACDRNPASRLPFGPPLTTFGESACGATATTTIGASSAFGMQSLPSTPVALQLLAGLPPHSPARGNIARFLSTPPHAARTAFVYNTPSQMGASASAGALGAGEEMKATSAVPSSATPPPSLWPQRSGASANHTVAGAAAASNTNHDAASGNTAWNPVQLTLNDWVPTTLSSASAGSARTSLKLDDEDMAQGLQGSCGTAAAADNDATLQTALSLMDPHLADAVHRVTLQGKVSAMDAILLIAHVGLLDNHDAKLLPLEVMLLLWTRETLAAPPPLHPRVQHTARDICLRMGMAFGSHGNEQGMQC